MKNIVNLRKDMEKLTKLSDKRADLLEKIDERWLGKCEPCNLVNDAVRRGELAVGTTKSSRNSVCAACPIHREIQQLGRQLDKNLIMQRKERMKLKEKYGTSRLVNKEE